jgi:diguanylate cyclase (GGDEF)-like protein
VPYPTGSAATQLLAEFLAVMSGFPDESSATRAAVERAAEALEAEVGAVLRSGSVTSVGFPANQRPDAALQAAVLAPDDGFDLPGVGHCHVVVGSLGDAPPGYLLLARAEIKFTVEEEHLVRAMARMLSLTLAMMHTIAAERALREQSERQAEENKRLLRELQERNRFVEALAAIEGSISRRAPLTEILDTITAEARQLLDGDAATLRLIDADAPSDLLLVAAAGFADEHRNQLWRLPLTDARASGQALAKGGVVVIEAGPDGSGCELPDTLCAAIAAPVHESGTPIGSLLVATRRADRTYGEADRQVLLAFAEHVSLALTDAKTVQEMRQAFHDSLTGLASRALFLDKLEHQLAAGRLASGLLFIDLDRFKPVNDTLGHAAGDELLVEVAVRIQQCLRSGDTGARFGGDEFAALLCDVDLDEAIAISDRITERIREPYHIMGKQVFVNASTGIAMGTGDGQDAAELLRNADVAMYRAKRRGEGQREIFEPAMHAELLARMQMEADLRAALPQGEFDLTYQPIVALATGVISSFEAQVRWRHPKLGLVPPDEFVPLAEETGLIAPIGRWMLEQACRQARAWQLAPIECPPVGMHVNLSLRQLQQPEFATEVSDVLAACGLTPDRLVLEITETLVHHDADLVIDRLGALKALGIRIAIDGFGTGHFSLSNLRRLPVDILKIGRSFVEGLTEGAENLAFVSMIMRLGETLRLETIADDIGTVEQFARLREVGCRYGQGDHFARPMDAQEADAALRAARALGYNPAPSSSVAAGRALT